MYEMFIAFADGLAELASGQTKFRSMFSNATSSPHFLIYAWSEWSLRRHMIQQSTFRWKVWTATQPSEYGQLFSTAWIISKTTNPRFWRSQLKSMENSLSFIFSVLSASTVAKSESGKATTQIFRLSWRSNSSRLFWLREGQLHSYLLSNQLLRPRLTIPSISVFACRSDTDKQNWFHLWSFPSTVLSLQTILLRAASGGHTPLTSHCSGQSVIHGTAHVHVDDRILTIPAADKLANHSRTHVTNMRIHSTSSWSSTCVVHPLVTHIFYHRSNLTQTDSCAYAICEIIRTTSSQVPCRYQLIRSSQRSNGYLFLRSLWADLGRQW